MVRSVDVSWQSLCRDSTKDFGLNMYGANVVLGPLAVT